MNILLVCANGASTGVLVRKMKTFTEEHEKLKHKEINIDATSIESLRNYLQSHKIDVVLVAPQIRFKEDEVKEICSEYPIGVGVIDTQHYGRMDAASVLKQAINLFKSK
ncbi:PTS sugar transporter subunit IIB [Clostridium hydrogeniformans]|uniref:PTS sugar transporter subunit IIB n=1 Tax=Clostridium hydrogeniformans TaxID=349933 RepID=UPI0004842721|nr:PTS sugar transporter subunit IIB [Clostridium hydrogeniformans]